MTGRPTAATAALGLILAGAAGPERARADFFLRDGDRVVFFGDSITQAGLYVEYIEAFVRTRFPDRRIEILNRGVSSETISGTSEPDHHPRRPWAHDRFARDIVGAHPTVLVACFGMNDGNYHPFDRRRFELYKEGVELLLRRTRAETGARLVLLTPPPFDVQNRHVADPHAEHYGYKFPAPDYDRTLRRYSRWLLRFARRRGVASADLHEALNRHLVLRRRSLASYSFSPDGVHPNATGHWLMAQEILLAWEAPAAAGEAVVDVGAKRAAGAGVEKARFEKDGRVRFDWRAPLPLPEDPAWDARSIELAGTRHRLNRYRLTVTGGAAARYRIEVDGVAVGEAEGRDLERGLDLLRFEAFPPRRESLQVLDLVRRRARLAYRTWRRSLEGGDPAELESARKEAQRLEEKIGALSAPKTRAFTLVPLESSQ